MIYCIATVLHGDRRVSADYVEVNASGACIFYQIDETGLGARQYKVHTAFPHSTWYEVREVPFPDEELGLD